MNLNERYEEFINAATLHGEATNCGDYKTANKQYTAIKNIFKGAQINTDLAQEFYIRLMNHENPSVKIWACAHSLALKMNISKAVSILIDLSQNKSLGIFRLDAEMTLKQWREKGYLKF